MSDLWKIEERMTFSLRELYHRYGYAQFKMSKFETYEFYLRNKEFLVSEGIITFTDTDGTLMALKPDVTLSIVKNFRDGQGTQKVCYNENVYRISGAGGTFREIMQTGLECIGDVGICEIGEVLLLAAKSLQMISQHFVLDISHLDLVSAILSPMELTQEQIAAVFQCLSEKNEDALKRLLPDGRAAELLRMMHMSGPLSAVLAEIEQSWDAPAVCQLQILDAMFRQAGLSDHVYLDFSIVNDMNYYNGLVFRGYVEGIPAEVLSGGQYDRLMDRMNKCAKGIGFAVYLDQLERLDQRERPYDVETVLLYDENTQPLAVLQDAQDLSQSGVLVLRSLPKNLRYRRVLQYRDGRLTEVEQHG